MRGMTGAVPEAVIEAAARATPDERSREMRLFLIFQQGLILSTETVASTAARATWTTLRAAGTAAPGRLAGYDPHVQPKICLRARNEAALARAVSEAEQAGLPCGSVLLPRLGKDLPMAMAAAGVGPARREELPRFIQKMQLFAHGPAPDAEPMAPFENPSCEAMWILVRRDLALSAGKLAAQAGHACWTAGGISAEAEPLRIANWEAAGCPVGVLWLEDLQAMQASHAAAVGEGLASAYIQDAGRTEIEPLTPTVLGIGPCAPGELPCAERLFGASHLSGLRPAC